MAESDKQAHINHTLWAFYGLILLLLLARLLPHPPNFTPVGVIGLFIGAYSNRFWHWLIPILAILLSDFLLGFYHMTSMIFVYLGIIASSAVGYFLLNHKVRMLRVFITTIISASLFFLLSNFGVWLSAELYPMTLAGLISCYVAAIPFFGNTMAAYIVFSAIAFTVYEFYQSKMEQHRRLGVN